MINRGWENEDFREEQGEIEGLIWRVGDSWVAIFQAPDGRLCRCAVEHCPFCGQDLHGLNSHKC